MQMGKVKTGKSLLISVKLILMVFHSVVCSENVIIIIKFSEAGGLQLQSAAHWVGFHHHSATLLPFPAPAKKFSFDTVFSLSSHSALKSTWRENGSLSGKVKNES